MSPRTSRIPVWLGAWVGVIYLALHLPVLILALFSFNASRYSVEWTGFTLEWYRALLGREDLIRGLFLSVLVATVATVVATVLGTLLALGLGRARRRRPTEVVMYLSLMTPEIVLGIALLALFAGLRISLGVTTIVIAHVVFCVAFVAIVVRARLEGLDRSLEEAALTLGADEWSAFRRVTLPRLAPGILAGALLAFTLSFDDYVITSLVAGTGTSTLPVVVYGMVRRTVDPAVNAVSTLVLVFTTLLIWLADRLSRTRNST